MSLKAPTKPQHARSRRNRVGLTSRNPDFHKFVSDLVRQYISDRKRLLRKDQRKPFRRNLECLILDLLSAAESGDDLWIGYSRGKSNYVKGGSYWNSAIDQPALSYTFYLAAIGLLERQGLIEHRPEKSGHKAYSSRIRPSERLVGEFQDRELNWTHIELSPDAPSIVVRNEEKKTCDWPDAGSFPLDLAISNLNRINEHLRSAHLNLHVADEELRCINRKLSSHDDEITPEATDVIDFSNRSLCRIFAKSSFDCGGRFYGGWQQQVPSKYRKHIEIEGKMTVELDYATIQPRMLYALKGLNPPSDAYIVPGWSSDLRKVSKKLFSQLLNSDKSSRNPKQWHRFSPALDPEPLPKNWSDMGRYERSKTRRDAFQKLTGRNYSDLIQDLLEFHAPIQDQFFTGAWTQTQNLDSQIVEKVLVGMLDQDVPETVLPIHDSFIVRRGAEPTLRAVMIEAFNQVIPSDVKIDRDEAIFDPPEGYVSPGHGVVCGNQVALELRENLETHRGYWVREAQWRRTWG